MSAIETICNAGCGHQFTIKEMPTLRLIGDIEKTFFTCPHCKHEYVASYTDSEIRKLQEKIRKTQRWRIGDPIKNYAALAKQEAKIRKQIKAKMDELRAKVER